MNDHYQGHYEARCQVLSPFHFDQRISSGTSHATTTSRTISVHPGLPWVKVESTAVEKDGYFEVLSITKAACSSLDGHDLTVDAFGY